MATVPVKVLLVGESGLEFSGLTEQLEKYGCECESVSGCVDGAQLVRRTSFDLVLCSGRMKGFQALVSAALHSSASLFRCLLVEDGCWWGPGRLPGQTVLACPGFSGHRIGQCARGHSQGKSDSRRSVCP
jgi:hypothetical protein